MEARKADHVRISLEENVQSAALTGFDGLHFNHLALPEIDWADISLATTFLGRRLGAPLLISSMTGGLDKGLIINRHLAAAAQKLSLPMGVGSQRIGLAQPDSMQTFQVRDVAPDILLLANLGAVQLNDGFGPKECRQLVDAIGANGLILHLNPLQEAVQPEGDRNWRGLLPKISQVCDGLDVPVIVKETGCGISGELAAQLQRAGVAAVDVAGLGGTSWALIESMRASDPHQRVLGQTFANWGIPTSEALLSCKHHAPDLPLIASGGMRTGLDVAKALALGAGLAGLAHPLLQPALQSAEAVEAALTQIQLELTCALFCLGLTSPSALPGTPLVRRP